MDYSNIQGGLKLLFQSELELYLKNYLDVALLQKLKGESSLSKPDRIFTSNQAFWVNAINNNLYPGQIIELSNFRILEWIPWSPGLFYTRQASMQRNKALESYRWPGSSESFAKVFFPFKSIADIIFPSRNRRIVEMRPSEKVGMVKGGYGSLRIAPKHINNDLQYINCASSTGVSHEGIAITMREEHYRKIIERIRNGEVPLVDIVGRLMVLPRDTSLINLRFDNSVPKFYIEVEKLETKGFLSSENATATIAVTYCENCNYTRNDFSYTFCSFNPTKDNADLKGAVSWLHDYAIRYSNEKNPLIIGDFDEFYDHFPDVKLPLKEVAKGIISFEEIEFLKKSVHIEINETFMGDKNIITNSQIGVFKGDATGANINIQQNNYALPADLDYLKLTEELNQLKAELDKIAQSGDERRAVAEVVDAKTASQEKDGNKVIKHLVSAGKWVFGVAEKLGVALVVDLMKRHMV